MAKKTNTRNTAIVQLYERELKSGAIRFYLHYTIDGQQTREALKSIPIVKKTISKPTKKQNAKPKRLLLNAPQRYETGKSV